MNDRKTRKNTLILITLLIVALSLAGCLKQPLSTHFDEHEVQEQAREVISLINDQDTNALRELCTVQLREALTDDVMAQIYEAISEGGTFQSIESISVGGRTDKASGEEFALIVVSAQYEIKRFTFTMTLTRQMKLAGLFYK